MKRLLTISSCCLLLLAGCGGSNDAEAVAQQAAQEKWTLYTDSFTEIVDISNTILSQYNDNLDHFYSGSLTTQQFKEKTTNLVPESRALLTLLDDIIYEVDPSLHEFHTQVLALVNKQHQLLLLSIQQSENERVNKENLRREYVEIKQNQMNLIQELKLIGQQ